MTLKQIQEKKQTGDVGKILTIVNTRRAEKGEPIYARSTIKHMLNGTRNIKDDVLKAASDYYQQLDKLTTAS